jgi:hypothetical protein
MNTVNLAKRSGLVSDLDGASDTQLFSISGRDFSDELHEIWATIFLQNIRGADFLKVFSASAADENEIAENKHILTRKQSDGAYFILFLYVAFIGASLNNFGDETSKLRSVLSRSYRVLLGKARYHFRSSYLEQLDFFTKTVISNSLWAGQNLYSPDEFRIVKTSFFIFCLDDPFEKTLLAHKILSTIEASELQQIVSFGGDGASDSQYLLNGYNVFSLFEQVKSYQRGVSRLRRMLTVGAKDAYEMNSAYRLLVDECGVFLNSHLRTAMTVSRKDFFVENMLKELTIADEL